MQSEVTKFQLSMFTADLGLRLDPISESVLIVADFIEHCFCPLEPCIRLKIIIFC